MKAALVIILLGSWGLMLILPWWSLIFACFIAGLMGPNRGYKAFLSGFVGVGGLWLVLAFASDFQNAGVLTAQVAELTTVPVWLLYVLTAVIGALTAGFACLSGYLVLGRGR